MQKSEKPCLGTGSRAKNWNPIGKPAPEIGVESTECGERSEQFVAAKQTISSGAHASARHAQERREVGTLWACKAEPRSMLREEGASCDRMLLAKRRP